MIPTVIAHYFNHTPSDTTDEIIIYECIKNPLDSNVT